jgi:hypothetical protein
MFSFKSIPFLKQLRLKAIKQQQKLEEILGLLSLKVGYPNKLQ